MLDGSGKARRSLKANARAGASRARAAHPGRAPRSPRTPRSPRSPRRREAPITLAVDIGGSHIKAALVDDAGRLVRRRHKVDTPAELSPQAMLDAVVAIGERVERFDRVSVGVNGLVHRGIIYAIPITGDAAFRGFDLAARLSRRWQRPVRVMNDALMHGLGAIRGRGVELVITLGTGLGTALFIDGAAGPQPQFTPAPSRREPRGGAYGDAAMQALGRRQWSRRVERLIDTLRVLTNFEHLYIGGGNAKRLACTLPRDASRIDNHSALLGGVRAWRLDSRP